MDMNETELTFSCQAFHHGKPFELLNVFICPSCLLDLMDGVLSIEKYRQLVAELRGFDI
jgi:hypothetical protein